MISEGSGLPEQPESGSRVAKNHAVCPNKVKGMTIQSAIQLFGGIGIFLFSIKLLSDSLQLLAGDRLRKLVGVLTRTPLLGVLVGTGVTVLVQSSSAVTVMTVSFVDAGLMTLKQAIGVIMGANIGTTVTGQILAFNVKNLAYLFIIAGVPLSFFCSSKRFQYIGNGLLGFGLLFIGMQTMENAMSFLRDQRELFVALSGNPLLGLLAGTLLTFFVQSSAATVGLTIALGMQGLLPLHAAIPIILGDNIGTTVTAALAAIGTNRAARRACAAHVLFNVIGVCVFLPLMPLYIGLVQATSSSIGHQIANAHTLFNVCNTLLFLPFVDAFARLIQKIIPDGAKGQAPRETRYLDPRLVSVTPVMAVDAVKNECGHMGLLALDMTTALEPLLFSDPHARTPETDGRETNRKNRSEGANVLALEERLDALCGAIRSYGDDILRAGIADDAARILRVCVGCCGDLERIGDANRQILRLHEQHCAGDSRFSAEAMQELAAMYTEAREAVRQTVQGFVNNDGGTLAQAEARAAHVREMEADLRMRHVDRLARGICNADREMLFIDLLSAMEHMAYRARKIARTARTAGLAGWSAPTGAGRTDSAPRNVI